MLHTPQQLTTDSTDKLYNVRDNLNLLKKKFQQFGTLSDEQMIPYCSKHSAKMLLNRKLLRVMYKAWSQAMSDAYVF